MGTGNRTIATAGVLLLLALLAVGGAVFFWPTRAVAEPGVTVGTRIDADGSAELDLRVDHLEPGASYLVRMSVPAAEGGTSASVGVLGRITADGRGTGRLVTRTVRVGAAGAEVPLAGELLAPPGREIAVVTASGDTVATVTVSVPR